MKKIKNPTACVIIIGNEILSGRTQDINVSFLSKWLNDLGVRVTEVRIIEDKEDFISLQHIMVMFFEQDDGSISDPIVVKHWRQDWHYEDKTINVYIGDNIWKKQTLSDKEIQGKWSQSVY